MRLQPDQIMAAREWLSDCFPDEIDAIEAATPERIEKYVGRHWDGGLDSFIGANPAGDCWYPAVKAFDLTVGEIESILGIETDSGGAS